MRDKLTRNFLRFVITLAIMILIYVAAAAGLVAYLSWNVDVNGQSLNSLRFEGYIGLGLGAGIVGLLTLWFILTRYVRDMDSRLSVIPFILGAVAVYGVNWLGEYNAQNGYSSEIMARSLVFGAMITAHVLAITAIMIGRTRALWESFVDLLEQTETKAAPTAPVADASEPTADPAEPTPVAEPDSPDDVVSEPTAEHTTDKTPTDIEDAVIVVEEEPPPPPAEPATPTMEEGIPAGPIEEEDDTDEDATDDEEPAQPAETSMDEGIVATPDEKVVETVGVVDEPTPVVEPDDQPQTAEDSFFGDIDPERPFWDDMPSEEAGDLGKAEAPIAAPSLRPVASTSGRRAGGPRVGFSQTQAFPVGLAPSRKSDPTPTPQGSSRWQARGQSAASTEEVTSNGDDLVAETFSDEDDFFADLERDDAAIA